MTLNGVTRSKTGLYIPDVTDTSVPESLIAMGDGLESLDDKIGKVLIAEVELLADTASFDFQSIPDDFTHLLICGYARSTRASSNDSIVQSFNGDTTDANYNRQSFLANSTTLSGAIASDRVAGHIPGNSATANRFGAFEILIPNYAQATNNKATLARSWYTSTGAVALAFYGTQWANNAAINRVVLSLGTGPNFLAGSLASLYGLG